MKKLLVLVLLFVGSLSFGFDFENIEADTMKIVKELESCGYTGFGKVYTGEMFGHVSISSIEKDYVFIVFMNTSIAADVARQVFREFEEKLLFIQAFDHSVEYMNKVGTSIRVSVHENKVAIAIRK